MAPPISLLRSTYFLTDVSRKLSKSSTDSGTGSSAGLGGEIVDAAATAAGAARAAGAGELLPDALVLRLEVVELLPFSFGAVEAGSSKAGVTKSSNLDVAASNLFPSLISVPSILVVQIGLLVILNRRWACA